MRNLLLTLAATALLPSAAMALGDTPNTPALGLIPHLGKPACRKQQTLR